jgi:ABC-2 type transport system permease protein
VTSTTNTTPTIPLTLPDRLRRAIVDAWTVTRRDLTHQVRHPFGIIIHLLFPVMVLQKFVYVFIGTISLPGGEVSGSGDYREFLMPGMFAVTTAFGLEATVMSVSNDAARGVTDRFCSMPMSPSRPFPLSVRRYRRLGRWGGPGSRVRQETCQPPGRFS